jgi:hypothetical protein
VLRAVASLRSISANTPMTAASPAMPSSPATTRPALGVPCSASSASARIGAPSLTKLFQMPVPAVRQAVLDAYGPALTAAIDELSATLTTDALIRLNRDFG